MLEKGRGERASARELEKVKLTGFSPSPPLFVSLADPKSFNWPEDYLSMILTDQFLRGLCSCVISR